jgi:fluoroquinolone transport system permease protein
MNAINILKSLGPIDARNISRDSSLKWMIFLPIFTAFLTRLALPAIAREIEVRWVFDLLPYYPLILSFVIVLLTPLTFGVLVGFLLLDERDDNTLIALLVSPLPLRSYIIYRTAVPILLTVIMTFAVSWIVSINQIGFLPLLSIGVVAAPLAPLFALFLASTAQNKVQGFAIMKGAGIILELPALAFFFNTPWTLAFGLVPVFWPLKLYWELSAGNPMAWIYGMVGLNYQIVLLQILLNRFNKVLHN